MKRVVVQVLHTNVDAIVESILRSIWIQNTFFISYALLTIVDCLQYFPSGSFFEENVVFLWIGTGATIFKNILELALGTFFVLYCTQMMIDLSRYLKVRK